jgi:hypothetical protein
MSNDASHDPDTARVIELLRGAECGPRDPDVELAEMLLEMETTDTSSAVTRVLERLANDANSN